MTNYVTDRLLNALNKNPDYNPFNGQVFTPEWFDSTIGGIGVYESVTGKQIISRILGSKITKRLYGVLGGIWLGNKYRNNKDHTGRKIEFKLEFKLEF